VDTQAFENALKKQVDDAKKQNQRDFEANKEEVINMIAERVITINLKLQRNVVGDYSSCEKKL